MPTYYITYQEVIETNCYFIGMAGKGWEPAEIERYGRDRNPEFPKFENQSINNRQEEYSYEKNYKSSTGTYATNFNYFLE